jgi:hypothetical protein
MTRVRHLQGGAIVLAVLRSVVAAPGQTTPGVFSGFDGGVNRAHRWARPGATQAAIGAAVGPTNLIRFEKVALGIFTSLVVAPGACINYKITAGSSKCLSSCSDAHTFAPSPRAVGACLTRLPQRWILGSRHP